MIKRNSEKTQVTLFVVLFISLIQAFGSFSSEVFAAQWTCNCNPQLCEAYNDAVAEAAQPLTLNKVSKKLTAIVPENGNLIWENDVVGSRVLVAIYGWGLNPDPGQLPNPAYSLRTNKWVTVAPELYNFFKARPFTDTRIEQLLGLPPCYGNTKIIEIFVSPIDLFRPSPDPETTDQEASVEFPWRTSRLVTYDTSRTIYDDFCETTPCYSDYETWFNNRRSGVYTASPPYPWTGLGYTYDWAHNSRYSFTTSTTSHVGLSEFVVTPTTVGVLRISDADDYFRSHKERLTVSIEGAGTITSRPNGIYCGGYCTKTFNRYAKVTLIARATSSTVFSEWGGACAYAQSSPVCVVTMVDEKTVEAVFTSR